jgi:cell division protein FtsB
MSTLVGRGIIVLLGAVFIVYFAYELVSGYIHTQSVPRRHAGLKAKYEDLIRQNENLRIRLTEVRSSEFIELTARDKLGLVRPGETAYKIVKED